MKDTDVIAALTTGVARFDRDGELVEGNPAFAAALTVGASRATNFAELFGRAPAACAHDATTIVDFGPKQYAVATKAITGHGWLCQLHDVTMWLDARTAAEKLAVCDGLTGLGNRACLLPEVERAATDQTRAAALLMIDLDRFKAVNDTLGHPVGDALLRKVAERLVASVRATDLVARLGGDEFAVLQTGVGQPVAAETLAKRLVEVLSRPYVIEGHMMDVGASVGIALVPGAADGDTLFKQADIALYRAKHGGRGRYAFFEPHMDEEMQARRALELDMRRALAFRQFELHYQPQMCLKTRTVTGMEALLRWRHPDRGLVSPANFIPLAEETGLIVPIGEWVVRQACQDAASWPESVAVAVNVSAKQLASGKLVRAVEAALARAGLGADRLEIEITESVLMSDIDGCVDTLHRLRALGARVSMDDFGTGYSSLSYLSSFPFDKIKIDQSFVRSGDAARNEGIIRAITAIGNHLGMTTIAEGIETEAQLGLMTDNGCGSVQGYLISRPVPVSEVAALFETLRNEPVPKPTPAVTVVEPDNRVVVPERDLHRLVYYSRNAIFGLDEEVTGAVSSILKRSQANNAADGVTGALMFTDGYFAQVLEGRREAVERVFERIQLDDRHAEVQLLSFAAVSERVFPNWAMAFVGNDERGCQMFGHYAASSDFDFAAADGELMVRHLRDLLVAEEGVPLRAAA